LTVTGVTPYGLPVIEARRSAAEVARYEYVPAHRRREAILAELIKGNAQVADLSERFGVSASTVRRDLQALSDGGQVTRTYGGAVLGSPHVEPNLHQKGLNFPGEKDGIAKTAVQLIRPGETVILDAGTTTGWLAWHMRDFTDLRVVTAGVNALVTLHESEQLELIVLGGQLNQANQAVTGLLAQENLSHIRADKVFLGADGISATYGMCSRTLELSALKQAMVRCAREVFVLADRSKIGAEPFPFWFQIGRPFTVITDGQASQQQIELIESLPNASMILAD
jgi:DeoR family fructose operon transcriptional repressor